VPRPDRIPAALHTEIKIVCEMMLKTHYFEEANWLWMAVGMRSCPSGVARRVAREFGFPNVSKWVLGEVLTVE